MSSAVPYYEPKATNPYVNTSAQSDKPLPSPPTAPDVDPHIGEPPQRAVPGAPLVVQDDPPRGRRITRSSTIPQKRRGTVQVAHVEPDPIPHSDATIAEPTLMNVTGVTPSKASTLR